MSHKGQRTRLFLTAAINDPQAFNMCSVSNISTLKLSFGALPQVPQAESEQYL